MPSNADLHPIYTLQRGVVTRQPLRGGCQELFQCFNLLPPCQRGLTKVIEPPELGFLRPPSYGNFGALRILCPSTYL